MHRMHVPLPDKRVPISDIRLSGPAISGRFGHRRPPPPTWAVRPSGDRRAPPRRSSATVFPRKPSSSQGRHRAWAGAGFVPDATPRPRRGAASLWPDGSLHLPLGVVPANARPRGRRRHRRPNRAPALRPRQPLGNCLVNEDTPETASSRARRLGASRSLGKDPSTALAKARSAQDDGRRVDLAKPFLGRPRRRPRRRRARRASSRPASASSRPGLAPVPGTHDTSSSSSAPG